MIAEFKKNTNLDGTLEFRETADQICAIFAKYDVAVKGYHDPELPHYNALDSAKKAEILHLLKAFLQSMRSTEASGGRFDDNNRSLWGAFSSLGLVPPSNLFSNIASDAVIELYDMTGRQIWRNFTFMKYCTYTLEEMYALEWFARYRRAPEVQNYCVSIVGALLSGQTDSIIDPKIPLHLLEEICSQGLLKLEMDVGIFSTLKDTHGKLSAWLVLSTAKILSKGKERSSNARPALAPLEPSADL